MIVYINSEFKCHLENDGTMTEVQTNFFDGKCKEFIEGYRFVPADKSWTREDGIVFAGEMATPFKPYSELDEAQRVYETSLLSETQEALQILLGEVS